MTAPVDFVALQWLRGELQATLGQARQALDAPSQGAELCQALLHQAHGALQVLELPGAASLAAEMERLAHSQPLSAHAATLLKRAMLQLPIYLQRVHLARRDLPQVLLPLLNELRTARGAPALADTPPEHEVPPAGAADAGLDDAPLDGAWFAREREYLNAPDRDALRSVVAALCVDLVRHKERLEALVRSGRQQPAALAELLPPLRQVADTLAVLGFEQPRRVIIEQLGVIQTLAQGEPALRDAQLMDVAGALVYVENTLAGMAGQGEDAQSSEAPSTDIQHIRELVYREVLVGLEQVKASIDDGQLGGWSAARLHALFDLIDPLRGALAMIPLHPASALLALANDWVMARARAEPAAPSAHALEHLALALCAIEYHLQRLLLDPAESHVPSLDQARDALAAMGLELPGGSAQALETPQSATDATAAAPMSVEDAPDEQLLAIFQAEAHDYVAVLAHFVARCRREGPELAQDDLHRALHTLKGSAYMAGVVPVAELAAGLDLLSREYTAHHLTVEPADTVLLEAALVLLRGLLAALPNVEPAADEAVATLVQRLRERCTERLAQWAQTPAADAAARRAPQPVGDFLAQGMDILLDAENLLREWRQHPQERRELDGLLDKLTALAHGAHAAGLQAVDALCEALLDVYGAVEDASLGVGPLFFDEAELAHEALIDMLDQLAAGQTVQPVPERVAALHSLLEQALAPGAMGTFDPATGQLRAWDDAEASEETQDEANADQELLQVFLDEGFDIVESAGAALLRWQAEPGNTLEVENLLRDLHTLKGGARMVEIAPVGNLAHELETLYERLSAGVLHASPELFKLLQKGHDRLGQMLDAVGSGQPVQADATLLARIRGFGVAAFGVGANAAEPLAPADNSPALLERGPADMVKVTAQVLEDLGNLAGEAAIARGRVEQQVNDTRSTLYEVDITLQRMRDQLLRLDSETQAGQREQAHERAGYEEFDPLEMDRHSQLQQLTRALFESVSDLLDLKDTLDDRTHEAQALLAHQARVSSQLQEGLMRTRMVPFERVIPRLQRIVRQVAEELGKQVNFETGHADAEVDRTVLEHMIAPLEHMLRNAVDHGLEPAALRRAAGKPDVGLITLQVAHEGAEVVIEMADDGAGVPLDAVRSKAIKRGLLAADSDMSDHDVMQFILQPGFSTAQKITQISGRGLGMDVVHEEVKQLGGSMTIDSRRGIGARFQIRLPLEVSVNRALLVQCGEQLYAVPLNSIEGIVRVKPAELDARYRHDPPRYRYGGISHELRYLGQLLHSAARPELLGEEHALPVLLVRSHDHQVAVQVDAINGSREIVVKSLGPQFSAVPGLNGATILGDGRVVLILDLLGQIRAQHLRPHQNTHGPLQAFAGGGNARPRLVLVVDDSVTVRKVTSRLLARHGMRVLTARDGVEAMAILREHRPDVLLLDIEMPRMDGFEVASKVRKDSRLKTIPIIMVTSRTGEKHRERATAIGVNEFLGKPFQENQLLISIAKWSRPHA